MSWRSLVNVKHRLQKSIKPPVSWKVIKVVFVAHLFSGILFCRLFAEKKRALSLHISKLEVICLPKNIKKNILRYSNAKWYICCQVPKTTQFCRYTAVYHALSLSFCFLSIPSPSLKFSQDNSHGSYSPKQQKGKQ